MAAMAPTLLTEVTPQLRMQIRKDSMHATITQDKNYNEKVNSDVMARKMLAESSGQEYILFPCVLKEAELCRTMGNAATAVKVQYGRPQSYPFSYGIVFYDNNDKLISGRLNPAPEGIYLQYHPDVVFGPFEQGELFNGLYWELENDIVQPHLKFWQYYQGLDKFGITVQESVVNTNVMGDSSAALTAMNTSDNSKKSNNAKPF